MPSKNKSKTAPNILTELNLDVNNHTKDVDIS